MRRRVRPGGGARRGASGVALQMMTGATTARQIGSECLILPDTCPGQAISQRLACSGLIAPSPEKQEIPWRCDRRGVDLAGETTQNGAFCMTRLANTHYLNRNPYSAFCSAGGLLRECRCSRSVTSVSSRGSSYGFGTAAPLGCLGGCRALGPEWLAIGARWSPRRMARVVTGWWCRVLRADRAGGVIFPLDQLGGIWEIPTTPNPAELRPTGLK
jgi:hypothetical protein